MQIICIKKLITRATEANLEGIIMDLQQIYDNNINDNYNARMLLYAIKNRINAETINFLLDNGINPNEMNITPHWTTPLILASSLGYLNIVNALITKGAYINATDYKKETSLYKAVKKEHIEVVYALLKFGAKIETKVLSITNPDPLRKAFELGNEGIMKALLEYRIKIEVNVKNTELTSLYIAINEGYLDLVQMFFDPNTVNLNIYSFVVTNPPLLQSMYTLHQIIALGYLDILNILLEGGAEVNLKYLDGATPLHIASRTGHAEIVQMLLEKGARFDKTYKGDTPLHMAVEKDYEHIVNILLNKVINIDVNLANGQGETPLHIAAKNGNLNLVKIFLNRGAKADTVNNDRLTPLYHSLRQGHLEIFKLILESSFKINFGNSKDWFTPLHLASEQGYLEAIKLLLNKGASTDEISYGNITPLHLAVKHNNLEAVKLLLKAGANINKNYGTGTKTPLCIASEFGHVEIVKFLLNTGAKINGVPKYYLDIHPLHLAAEKGHVEIVKELVYQGAEFTSRDKDYLSPLDKAIKSQHIEVVLLLSSIGCLEDLSGLYEFYTQNSDKILILKDMYQDTLFFSITLLEHILNRNINLNREEPLITNIFQSIHDCSKVQNSLLFSNTLSNLGLYILQYQKFINACTQIKNLLDKNEETLINCLEAVTTTIQNSIVDSINRVKQRLETNHGKILSTPKGVAIMSVKYKIQSLKFFDANYLTDQMIKQGNNAFHEPCIKLKQSIYNLIDKLEHYLYESISDSILPKIEKGVKIVYKDESDLLYNVIIQTKSLDTNLLRDLFEYIPQTAETLLYFGNGVDDINLKHLEDNENLGIKSIIGLDY